MGGEGELQRRRETSLGAQNGSFPSGGKSSHIPAPPTPGLAAGLFGAEEGGGNCVWHGFLNDEGRRQPETIARSTRGMETAEEVQERITTDGMGPNGPPGETERKKRIDVDALGMPQRR